MNNFKEQDFQFHGQIANTGFKRYYDEDENNVIALLVETQLPKALTGKDYFTAQDLSYIFRN